jgi:eukaryotic-like serine/threonine-protein kinase
VRSRIQVGSLAALAFIALGAKGRATDERPPATTRPTPSELAGTWVGTLVHAGESRPIALTLEPTDKGKLKVKLSTPALHLWEVPIGEATPESPGLRIGRAFVLVYDQDAGTLAGVIPPSLVPLYQLAVTFRREPLVKAPRPELVAPLAAPVWTFDAAAPIWTGASFADGVVYVGADDGRLHALDARTGKARWSVSLGAAVRSRLSPHEGDLYVHTDDGWLHRLRSAGGEERWKVRLEDKPIDRVTLGDAKSRYDDFASGARGDKGRLYVGTHDGHVLCLDASSGARIWDFAAGDSVVATPVVDRGLCIFGSFDGKVYGLDQGSGKVIWTRDTGGPVVSTPAIADGHVIVGSRSYDLLALDTQTGIPAWTRYIWFSWIESPVTVAGDTLYVGSSDAAKLFAFEARTGRPRWEVDVRGWAWGQPAVGDKRAFIGTAGIGQYMVKHQGGVLAVDKATGRPAWKFPVEEPTGGGVYGFPGSPAVGEGLVFIGGLSGRVYAFVE